MQSAKILFCILLVFVVHGTLAWLGNQPQDAGPDVPSGKLRSLSFAPYRDGFSPITHTFPLPEHIDADIGLVADKTYNIRTYSARGGMEPTPDFARKHGVDVILGGWLGDSHPENRIEIDKLIETANAHPDVVKRVIVGNEVLLRKDMNIDTLIGYIRQVKQAIKQPVTYADVWSSYLQYPQLFAEVDFITIHILPYWEDEPVHIDQAAAHVEKIVRLIQDKAHEMGQDKPLLIGESGWPAIGRQRGYAVPGVVNEARFIRELIQVANRHNLDYNIVEAFNQPWKSHHEGVVGANWGLLTIDREPVFPLTGLVYENPDWPKHLAWKTGLFLLIAAVYLKRLQSLSLPRLLVFLALAQLLTIGLVALAHYQWHTSYNDWQRIYSALMLTANALMGGLLLQRCHAILAGQIKHSWQADLLKLGFLLFVLMALYETYHLAIDGRYLTFPVRQFAIPAIGMLALTLCHWIDQGRMDCHHLSFDALLGSHFSNRLHRLFAVLLSLGGAGVIAGETYSFLSSHDFIEAHPKLAEGLPVALTYTLENAQLVAWTLGVLMLSIPFWTGPRLHGKRQSPARKPKD